MRQECRERFLRPRGQAIPTWITARAWRTCRDACRGCYLAVSVEVGGGQNVPGIPGACATRNITYLARGPWQPMGTITIASGWFMYRSRLNRWTAVNFEIVSTPGAVKCGFTSVKRQESRIWLVHRIPWTSIARYVLWNERQAPRFQRK